MKAAPVKVDLVKAEPVMGAGFDPAFVPGITGPTPTDEVTKSPEPALGTAPVGDSAQPRSSEPVSSEPASSERVDAGGADAGTVTDADTEDKADGPVFEASDRRARIVADHKGVRLSLDEEACEFRWDEIAAVETESPRFGKRYTITVHTPDRRWYPIEIEAAARARFKEWDEQLDAVLDAYFEEA
ncbi:hypothetical protein C3492_30340 [Streptomyces sp. Ru62]|uniref:hypothetical protein n=1 Tax=Streptomyces sp. Ru62 TaxID=2080745 RepID=UPI000CDDA5F8|nr:hypothetical protein [Streptomyces sp. Ru62]POX59910.1 hypothetical protein C3492_30340 [Streptomyces sp. Ru62]